jgi:RimJ/RimL family protein N-acetyltransferase
MPVHQTPMGDLALMRIDADTLFTYDARGRMMRTNEPENRPAPRLFLGRTSGGQVVRFGEAVPESIAERLAEVVERQPPTDDLRVPPSMRTAIRAILERHAPIANEWGGPNYRFPASIAQPAGAIEVTPANVEVVRDTFPWLYQELAGWGPCFAVMRDGTAVSACFSSRIGAQAMEAGVFTLPGFRGHGYAVSATAAWGAAVRGLGRIPLYSTAWENVASQGVARRLGLIVYGATATWT